MDRQNLTHAIKLLISGHKCPIYNYCSARPYFVDGCACTNITGIRDLRRGMFYISPGVLKPLRYRFTPRDFNVAVVQIECQRLEGTILFPYTPDKGTSGLHCIYEVVLGEKITQSKLVFYDSLDTEGFRELPEPNDEGEYIITPPGGLSKACRSTRK